MKKNIQVIELPYLSEYGAKELKSYLSIATYKAFGTVLLLSTAGIFLLLGLSALNVGEINDGVFTPPPIDLVIIKGPEPPIIEIKIPNDVPTGKSGGTSNGTTTQSGVYVPTDDSKVDKDQKIATTDIMGDVSSKVGTADNINETKLKEVETNPQGNGTDSDSYIPSETDFTPVEVDPSFDLAELQKAVVYPELARRNNISGEVLIQALIDENGNVMRAKVAKSDNLLLNDEALKAIQNFKKIKPAIQNGKNVKCWIYIPIKFRLR